MYCSSPIHSPLPLRFPILSELIVVDLAIVSLRPDLAHRRTKTEMRPKIQEPCPSVLACPHGNIFHDLWHLNALPSLLLHTRDVIGMIHCLLD